MYVDGVRVGSVLIVVVPLTGKCNTFKIRHLFIPGGNVIWIELIYFTGEDSPMSNLMLSVMGAFAESERALIRQRQREDIALAKQRGAYRGGKKSLWP